MVSELTTRELNQLDAQVKAEKRARALKIAQRRIVKWERDAKQVRREVRTSPSEVTYYYESGIIIRIDWLPPRQWETRLPTVLLHLGLEFTPGDRRDGFLPYCRIIFPNSAKTIAKGFADFKKELQGSQNPYHQTLATLLP